MEGSDIPTDTLTETQICYGPPNNNTNSTKNKTSSNSNNNGQHKVTVLKRNSTDNQKKETNSDIQCMLCNQSHATYRCTFTRKLRDGQIKAPPNFCWSHCGRVYDLCQKKTMLHHNY